MVSAVVMLASWSWAAPPGAHGHLRHHFSVNASHEQAFTDQFRITRGVDGPGGTLSLSKGGHIRSRFLPAGDFSMTIVISDFEVLQVQACGRAGTVTRAELDRMAGKSDRTLRLHIEREGNHLSMFIPFNSRLFTLHDGPLPKQGTVDGLPIIMSGGVGEKPLLVSEVSFQGVVLDEPAVVRTDKTRPLEPGTQKSDGQGELHRDSPPTDPSPEPYGSNQAEHAPTGGDLPYPAGEASLKRRQNSVRSLLIRTTDDGDLQGLTSDVIATVAPDKVGQGACVFVRPVGEQMRIAMQEAIRMASVRHPGWEPARIEFSFAEKYVPKDGGSAGAAFTLLLLSLLDDIAIDPKVAMTGDIAVNGRIQPIGGTVAKVRAAAVDGAHLTILPADNAAALSDLVLLHPLETLWQAQVFSVETIDQVVALARTDRDGDIKASFDQFTALATRLGSGNRNAEVMLRSPDIRSELEAIIARTPNHESAQLMLKYATNQHERRLTRSATLVEAFIATRPYHDLLFNGTPPDRADISRETTRRTADRIRRLQLLGHPDTTPLVRTLMEFVHASDAFAGSRTQTNAKRLVLKMQKVADAFQSLGGNREAMEQMSREGF